MDEALQTEWCMAETQAGDSDVTKALCCCVAMGSSPIPLPFIQRQEKIWDLDLMLDAPCAHWVILLFTFLPGLPELLRSVGHSGDANTEHCISLGTGQAMLDPSEPL